jgi:hypothetical protein
MTATPFLQALVGKVTIEVFPDADAVQCAVALSSRRFLPPDLKINDNVVGLWVSAFHLEYSRRRLEGLRTPLSYEI